MTAMGGGAVATVKPPPALSPVVMAPGTKVNVWSPVPVALPPMVHVTESCVAGATAAVSAQLREDVVGVATTEVTCANALDGAAVSVLADLGLTLEK